MAQPTGIHARRAALRTLVQEQERQAMARMGVQQPSQPPASLARKRRRGYPHVAGGLQGADHVFAVARRRDADRHIAWFAQRRECRSNIVS